MSGGPRMTSGPRMKRAGWALTGLALVVAGLTCISPRRGRSSCAFLSGPSLYGTVPKAAISAPEV